VIHGCNAGYFCFYFNSKFAGARADYVDSDGNLDNETFTEGGSNGRGVQVKNNAASAVNNWAYYAAVYYNSGCNGAYASANFDATMKNETRASSAGSCDAGSSDLSHMLQPLRTTELPGGDTTGIEDTRHRPGSLPAAQEPARGHAEAVRAAVDDDGARVVALQVVQCGGHDVVGSA
jgi:Peptidase inhibitor family I36